MRLQLFNEEVDEAIKFAIENKLNVKVTKVEVRATGEVDVDFEPLPKQQAPAYREPLTTIFDGVDTTVGKVASRTFEQSKGF